MTQITKGTETGTYVENECKIHVQHTNTDSKYPASDPQ